ncbi:hypothetical protein H310_13226 [Aphanomyces invadans]|uniref:PIH1D1/2/3 CS-like domain-containing protein n=1 Tax=Aphanomyces invadans TaxID=157072 RepID=A0A024TEU7_9STRA|nr:hypothetical protein H310_13226 [Aphanomyces invadans]ETV92563.1 hypothetical protein H310_13226 [Aphanomyces invadans]|eukprot:XP_008878870.1 hypothetical protein H310_13226 [Aphanomyces invadans]
MSSFHDLLALSDLLQPAEEDDRHEGAVSNGPVPHAHVALPKEAMNRQIGQIVTADPKAIWTDDEVGSDGDDDEFDTRRRPKHEVLFKQEVMTEDVFLGLGDKDPSVASCDAMTIKISFPGHRLDEIALDLTKHKLIAQSHALKLSLYLPNPVRHKQGKATWDATTDTLAVTVPIIKDEW